MFWGGFVVFLGGVLGWFSVVFLSELVLVLMVGR